MRKGWMFLRIIGFMLALSVVTLFIPLLVGLMHKDASRIIFAEASIVIAIISLLIIFITRNVHLDLRNRDGFLLVIIFWLVYCSIGAVILKIQPALELSWVDAVFEATSGLTATGATVLTGLDDLPQSLLIYRQQLNWLGGLGIVVLAVAVMPILGIGGMQLYRAEATGPLKDDKVTPRIANSAKWLWGIYISITILCAIGYRIAGMSWFDAVSHSFSTVSTGGFSTHDASFGYWDYGAIHIVCMFFMILGGINFALLFSFIRYRDLRILWSNPECKAYLLILLLCSILFFLLLRPGLDQAYFSAPFQVISFMTTSGFSTQKYVEWPLLLPVVLVVLGMVGGCGGSTTGGIKVMRVMMILLQSTREIHRLIHPRAIISVKFGGSVVTESIVDAIWGFLTLFLIILLLMTLTLVALGNDYLTAFSAVAACLSNTGPGIAGIAQNYQDIDAASKYILSLAMLMGRLELFTLLVLFSRSYWRA